MRGAGAPGWSDDDECIGSSHAPLAAYREVQRALGLERVIFVQATGYGFDNRCILDALAQTGASSWAVAILPPDAPDAELSSLRQAGVRGVRYMMIPGAGGPLAWDSIEAMAARLLPLGWHINLQLDGRELPARFRRCGDLGQGLAARASGSLPMGQQLAAPQHPAAPRQRRYAGSARPVGAQRSHAPAGL